MIREIAEVGTGEVLFVRSRSRGPELLQVGPVVEEEGRVTMINLSGGRTFDVDLNRLERTGRVGDAKVVDIIPTTAEDPSKGLSSTGTIKFPVVR